MRLLLAVMLSCFASTAMAADVTENALIQRLHKPEVLRASFSQSRQIAGFTRPVESSGSFVVARGRGLLWQTRRPFESTLSVTRGRLRITNGAGQPETMLDARREPMLDVLNDLLQSVVIADVTALKTRFDLQVRLVGDTDWELALHPRDKVLRERFATIELAGGAYVRKVRLVEKSGDVTTMLFDNHKEDTQLTESEAGKLK
ncbi:MAG: outer membrane lipoprotein carrier protein LolA [Pseudomonadota bacterium]